MAIPAEENLEIRKGSTFRKTLRWDTGVPVFKAISSVDRVAPAAVACTSHGIPEEWPVAIVSVKGMTAINTEDPEQRRYFTPASAVDGDNITLPFIDASSYRAYTSGGYVKYFAPVDLTGFTARMQIRKTKGATTAIIDLTDANGGLVLDNVAKTIEIVITDELTTAVVEKGGVFDLELESSAGEVFPLLEGDVEFSEEVTVPVI